MPEEATIKTLEARLTRLESTLSQLIARPGIGTIADPGPDPRPIADPAPWPWPRPIADPAPWPWYRPGGGFIDPGRFGPVGDPPPIDISRFTRTQLESSLHSIAAERIRLDGLEQMIQKQLEQL